MDLSLSMECLNSGMSKFDKLWKVDNVIMSIIFVVFSSHVRRIFVVFSSYFRRICPAFHKSNFIRTQA